MLPEMLWVVDLTRLPWGLNGFVGCDAKQHLAKAFASAQAAAFSEHHDICSGHSGAASGPCDLHGTGAV